MLENGTTDSRVSVAFAEIFLGKQFDHSTDGSKFEDTQKHAFVPP
jgi:hypothetical protein